MKLRLSIMNFLEFAVWGAYLTCMSNYLGVIWYPGSMLFKASFRSLCLR